MKKSYMSILCIMAIIAVFTIATTACRNVKERGTPSISEQTTQSAITKNSVSDSSEISNGVLPVLKEALASKYSLYTLQSENEHVSKDTGKIKFHEWDRAHAGFANWQQIEPNKGEYHWEFIDDYVKKTQADETQILFTIWPFTNWDQETGNSKFEWQKNDWGKLLEDFIYLANRKGKPCDMEAYRKFLRLLVERYDGDGKDDMPGLQYQIKYWEIGNEPDLTNFFQGTDKDYYEILKESYITIKETDAEAKVLIAAMPSLGYENFGDRQDFGHAEEIFKLGGGEYFDILNFHAYGEYERLKTLLKKYNLDNRPYWITEPTPGYSGEYLTKNFSLQQIKELFRKEIANGAEKIFIKDDIYELLQDNSIQ